MTDSPENTNAGSRPSGNSEPYAERGHGAPDGAGSAQPTQPYQPASAQSSPGQPPQGQPTQDYSRPPQPQYGVAAPSASYPASGASQGGYGFDPTTAATTPLPPYTQQGAGSPPQNVAPGGPSGDKPDKKRSGRVGVIAALAIGAIVGGVAGAGVFAIADGSNDDSVGGSAASPANVTVNDPSNATTVTGVVATAGPSVVTISVADSASGSGGTGSGVILSDDGYVVTNTHVVTLDGASSDPEVSVQTSDGRLYQAAVVGTDPISDLAVIKIDGGSDFQPVEFADSDALNVGDTAIAIGAPLGLSNTVTDGIVSSLNRSITVASSAVPESGGDSDDSEDNNGDLGPFDFWQLDPNGGAQTPPATTNSTIALPVIQTDAAINPGNSGGALLDADGKLIGINVAIASAGSTGTSTSGSIGVGFAIPANLAKRISSEIIDSGTGTHGLLGASVDDVDASTSSVVGALIKQVTSPGAAETAGLEAGDVVTAVGDVPVTGATDLTAQIRALAGGAQTTLTYVRDDNTETADVTLGTLG